MYFNIAEYIEVADSSSVIFALCQDFSLFLNNIFAIIAIFLITIYRHQIHKMLVLLNDCDRKLLLVGAKINYKRHFQFTLIFVAISCATDVALELNAMNNVYDMKLASQFNFAFSTYFYHIFYSGL